MLQRILEIFSYNINYMRILSIDIGIKHLAFCLFNIRAKDDYKIEKWGLSICATKKKCCVKDVKAEKNANAHPDIPKMTKPSAKYTREHATFTFPQKNTR